MAVQDRPTAMVGASRRTQRFGGLLLPPGGGHLNRRNTHRMDVSTIKTMIPPIRVSSVERGDDEVVDGPPSAIYQAMSLETFSKWHAGSASWVCAQNRDGSA
jgi:hypothetical protein